MTFCSLPVVAKPLRNRVYPYEIIRELHQESPTYGHVTKLFLELEFQHGIPILKIVLSQ